MPLLIDLLRHGRAEAHSTGGDDARALTPQGEESLRRLSRRLLRQGWHPDRVFSSPLKRARDTALIVTREVGLEIEVEELDELKAEVEAAAVVEALVALGATSGHVVLVGHQPQMGRLARHLTGAEPGFAPGDLVRVELHPPGRNAGRIVLALSPETEDK